MKDIAEGFWKLFLSLIGAAVSITMAALIVRGIIYLWVHFIL